MVHILHPQQIINTHLDFLRAGADIILTNTYQAWVEGFVKYLDVSPEEGYDLIHRAVELAKNARATYLEECYEITPPNPHPMVVGSVGPYGAHLHDGSEFSGDYADTTSIETMRDWHRPRIEALIEAGVDLLAFETIPCKKEAEMLVEMIKDYPDVKAWLSFSVKDDKSLSHGENFKMVAEQCYELNPEQLVAVGVNCCPPSSVVNLLRGINEGRKKPIPFVAYPNSGEKYNQQIGWIDRDKCEPLEMFVFEWLNMGVRYVGGCCRTYGTDITRIRNQVQIWHEHKKLGLPTP